MDSKHVFLREISWIQMNKDNIKAAVAHDIEQKVAAKLSMLQDESEHLENNDTREVCLVLYYYCQRKLSFNYIIL
jgi:hypothetical protein